ncbi:MAG: Dna2/Cas4 domain-containing protein [Clostridia bacterium]
MVFANEIQMEQNSELVSIGKILDETSYQREKKSIMIDDTINIDFISVILFKSRTQKWLDKQFLGKIEDDKTSNFL